MDSITLQNYRCFGSEEQTARLAPLTLLVGPNSTGKTSFLALIRALWDVAFREVVPNFREHPYDLGSWDDIVHQPGGRSKPADQFAAGFKFVQGERRRHGAFSFSSTFANYLEGTFPAGRSFSDSKVTVAIDSGLSNSDVKVRYRIGQGEWKENPEVAERFLKDGSLFRLNSIPYRWREIDPEDLALLDELRRRVRLYGSIRIGRRRPLPEQSRPFSSAPVRSRPRRTYDPMLLSSDGEGDYIPSYLAGLFRRDADAWQSLKRSLENFGRTSELFDEISVRSFGKSDGDPFQIQVRRHSGPNSRRRKGSWRNLIDVGYGVSQALPLLTELLRPDAPTIFLLQQPEVHLHPQAQAALGTLFCQTAAAGRQLVIETHSDNIIDRVRMDVRDGKTELKPEDVSILYFEPGDLNVRIHSIRIDKMGNVIDAPPGYRQFFMEEIRRSIGL